MASIPVDTPIFDFYYDFRHSTIFHVSCGRELSCVHLDNTQFVVPSIFQTEETTNTEEPCSAPIVSTKHFDDFYDLVCVDGSNDYTSFFLGSATGNLLQVDKVTGQVIGDWKAGNTKDEACVIRCNGLGNNKVLVGYESGRVRLWDVRQASKPVASFRGHNDLVTDVCLRNPLNTSDIATILSSGGDGTVSVFDLRGHTKPVTTESVKDEICCLCLMKDNSVLTCGTLEGNIIMYEWRLWDQTLDCLKGHPESVNSICLVDDDTILTGSDDGLIRLLNIHPNRLMGVVGEDFSLPIEKMVLDPESKMLACSSHEAAIRCFDASCLYEKDEDPSSSEEEIRNSNKKKKKQPENRRKKKKTSFFDGL
eukprot:jgi/Galph1/3334/GphlegSOOS_G1983.1